jgi:DNA-binding transcriptional regulator YdaS (Cro superfamily)
MLIQLGQLAMDLKTYLQQTTQTDLAHRLGVTQGLVHQWVTGKTRITAERAVEIEKATGGQVTRQELRPELFGAAVA